MSKWPFITCHTCRKPVRGGERAVLDLGGLPHHGKCLSIRGLPLGGGARPETDESAA